MKYSLVLSVFMLYSYIPSSRTAEPPRECQIATSAIDWPSNSIVVPGISDVETLYLVFPFTGEVTISTPDDYDTGAPYIEAFIDTGHIIIKTNDYFTTNFDKDTAFTSEGVVTVERTIIVACEGTPYPLCLIQPVTDSNNHNPTFLVHSYTYTLPMLMPGVDLTTFGGPLLTTDVDFSNIQMNFTVDPSEHFVLETEVLGNKEYRAILKVTEFVSYDAGLVLTITASDAGGMQGIATINIKRDESTSLPYIPRFSELVYEYRYLEDGGIPTIEPVDPNKYILVATSDPSLTYVTISNGTYVTATYDMDTNLVSVTSSGTAIDSSSEELLTLILSVSLLGQSTQAVIVVKLPGACH